MSEKETIRDLLEFGLSYLDELKENNKEYDIYLENNKEYHMKIIYNSLIRFIGIKSKINFRYGLSSAITTKLAETCLICKEDFKDIDVCRTPSCEHLFHSICICSLENKETGELKCPICEMEIILM